MSTTFVYLIGPPRSISQKSFNTYTAPSVYTLQKFNVCNEMKPGFHKSL